jgi:hypothetical protein
MVKGGIDKIAVDELPDLINQFFGAFLEKSFALGQVEPGARYGYGSHG